MSGSTKPAYIEPKKKPFFTRLKSELMYQFMVWTAIVFVFIFHYIPLSGIVIAFKNYKFRLGIWGSEWVGLANFVRIFKDFNMGNALTNTLALSLFSTVVGFPATIIFTLILNECVNIHFKKTVQTVSYLPHFISWVVTQGILVSFLNMQNGVLQQMMLNFGWVDEAVPIMTSAKYFWGMYILTDIWKETGWSAIIFLAAITGVDPTLYEAAVVDGASRMQRIWHITLPSIKGTISIMLIMSLGGLIGGAMFEPCYLLYNSLNASKSEILQTYTLKVGLTQGRYSYGTAVGLFQSVISIILVLISNQVSKWISGIGLF